MNIEELTGTDNKNEETENQKSQRNISNLIAEAQEDSVKETPEKSENSNINSAANT